MTVHKICPHMYVVMEKPLKSLTMSEKKWMELCKKGGWHSHTLVLTHDLNIGRHFILHVLKV